MQIKEPKEIIESAIARGLTREEISQKIDITVGAISHLMTGRSKGVRSNTYLKLLILDQATEEKDDASASV